MSEERMTVRHAVAVAQERVSHKLDDIWWWFMARGVLLIALAIVALFWPQKTIAILVNVIGAAMLFDGVVGIIGAVRSGGQRGFPQFALVSLVVGAILLLWTGLSVRLFLTLVGVWALLQGAALYWANRTTDADVESRQLFASVGAVLAVIGLILLVWPTSGVVALSWLMAVTAAIIGSALIFIAVWLRRLKDRLGSMRDKVQQT